MPASDGSFADTKAKYDAAVDGDVITLPSGTFDWSAGPLVVSKGVTFMGAGPNATFLQGDGADNVFTISGGTNDSESYWTPSGTFPRISNMTMQYSDAAADPDDIIKFEGHCMEFRIDHCDFRAYPHTGLPKSMFILTPTGTFWGWGLVDHCHFDSSITSDAIQTDQPAWIPILSSGQPDPSAPTIPKRDKGDGGWVDGPHWAEGHAWRLEDNIFENGPNSIVGVTRANGRREIRFNLFIDATTGAHGAETNHPGGRMSEYYNNRGWQPTLASTGQFNNRATASVCFNNRVTNRSSIDRISSYRGWLYGKVYGPPTGVNVWDKNKKGNFTDVFGNEYRTDVALASVDPNPLWGDIYWTGTYTGATKVNTVGGLTTFDFTGAGLTNNGNGGETAKRWVGFILRNVTAHARILLDPSGYAYPAEGMQVDSSTATSLSVVGGGKFQIQTSDVVELRCADRYIHQSGEGKGDVLESYSNAQPDYSVTTPRGATNMSWNITQDLRIYPDSEIDGMWFWGNKCSLTDNDSAFVDADVISYGEAGAASPHIGVADNPQNYFLGRDIFIPGTDPAEDATDPDGRPPGYPYDAAIDIDDPIGRLRIGPDQECYDTFAYYNGGSGITNRTFFATSGNLAAGKCATHYWGRTYPDYLISAPEGIIIELSGDMAFGNVIVGQTLDRTLSVRNIGDDDLIVTSVSYPTGFSGATTGFTVAAGESHPITVTFAPVSAILYTGNITVDSNADSGTETIAVSGNGVTGTDIHLHRKNGVLIRRA